MPKLVEDGDRSWIEAGRLRLVFDWTGSRWVHFLASREPKESPERILARSLESDPETGDFTRVVSPTYQDLQFQTDGSSLQALLVGMAGPHHFSAVFTVEGEGSDLKSTIQVDLADRCRSRVEAFASTYLIESRTAELVDAGPERVKWDCGSSSLVLVPTTPAQISRAEAGRRCSQFQVFTTPDSGSATHRLIYRWDWQENPPET